MSSSDDEDAFEAFLSTFLTIFFLFLGISLFCACRRCCCARRLRRGVILGHQHQQPSAIINITRGAQQPIIRSTSPPPPLPAVPAQPYQPYHPNPTVAAYPGQYGATTTTTYYPVPGSIPPAQGPPPATFYPPPPPYEAMFPTSQAANPANPNSQPGFNPEFSAPPGYSEKQ